MRSRVRCIKTLAAAAVLALLVLPSGALAAGRTVVFNARVVRVSSLGVVLRRAGGRTLRVSAAQLTRVPSGVSASGDGHAPLAHMTGSPRGIVATLDGLAPGVIVRVNETAAAGERPTVALGLPKAAGRLQHAHGIVSSVFADSFLLDTPGGLELRLQGRVTGLRVCDSARVVYHQNHLTLVVDSVRPTGRSSCAR